MSVSVWRPALIHGGAHQVNKNLKASKMSILDFSLPFKCIRGPPFKTGLLVESANLL